MVGGESLRYGAATPFCSVVVLIMVEKSYHKCISSVNIDNGLGRIHWSRLFSE